MKVVKFILEIIPMIFMIMISDWCGNLATLTCGDSLVGESDCSSIIGSRDPSVRAVMNIVSFSNSDMKIFLLNL